MATALSQFFTPCAAFLAAVVEPTQADTDALTWVQGAVNTLSPAVGPREVVLADLARAFTLLASGPSPASTARKNMYTVMANYIITTLGIPAATATNWSAAGVLYVLRRYTNYYTAHPLYSQRAALTTETSWLKGQTTNYN